MAKRVLDESTAPKAKKAKVADESTPRKENIQAPLPPSKLTAEEIDFPRGGGSSFTPIEVKAIRAEALQEADEELFEVCRLRACAIDLPNLLLVRNLKRLSRRRRNLPKMGRM